MKEIKAFIRPLTVAEVVKELKENGFCCITVTMAEGTGNYTDSNTSFPSLRHPFSHSEIVKLEIGNCSS